MSYPPASSFLSLVFFLLREANCRGPCEPRFLEFFTSLAQHFACKPKILNCTLCMYCSPQITLQVPWSTPSETALVPVTLFKIQISEQSKCSKWPDGCHWPETELLKRHKEQESPQQSAGKHGSVEIHTSCGQQLPLVLFFIDAKAVKVGRVQLLTIYYL